MAELNTPENNNKTKKERPLWSTILLHGILIVITGLLLVSAISLWLNHWTRHDEIVYVPNVQGMQFDEAKSYLEGKGFSVELSDSVYLDRMRPGAVVSQNPKDSSSVRPNRTIYLTIKAFYPKMVTIPSLTDISLRQAKVALEGLGIKNITVKEVPSMYKDLIHGVFYNGKALNPGTRVPITAKIVLEVGTGGAYNENIANTDSASTTDNPNQAIDGEIDFFE